MTRRVLVVDDSATLRKITQTVLGEAGFIVDTAVDGAEGLERVQMAPFDLMLVDFVMPRLNGYQLTQAIRSIPSLRELPVVLMSARAEQIGQRFMAQTGAVGALAKPFTPDALVAMVTESLRDAPAQTLHPPPLNAPAGAPGSETEALTRTAEVPFTHGDDDAMEPIAQYFDTTPPRMSDGPDQVFAERLQALGIETRADAHLGTIPLLLAGAAPSLPPAEGDEAAARRALARELAGILREEGAVTDETLDRALARSLKGERWRALCRSRRDRVVLEGSIASVPLGEVFQLLHLQAQTGLLSVVRGEAEVTLSLHEGRIQQGFGRALGEEFMLGRYLVADELVRADELDTVVQTAVRQRALLGEMLVSQGMISPSSLEQCLLRQTSELVYEVLRWPHGEFRFEAGGSLAAAVQANLGLASESLVLEGFRRIDEWRLIAEYIPSERMVFARERSAMDALSDRLDSEERRVLDAADGRRNVRELIEHLKVNAFDGCKILFRLLRARLVVPVGA